MFNGGHHNWVFSLFLNYYKQFFLCLIHFRHYEVDANGQIGELDRVKLSGKVSGYKSAITWVTGTALAIITGEIFNI